MRKPVKQAGSYARLSISIMLVAALMSSACSTAGGMYSSGDPVNGQFSGWKTAGAVLLGVLTLGAVGAAAYAGASNPTYSNNNVTYVGGNSNMRTYIVNGEYVTCYRSGSIVNCY
jgi:hypothetical protein